MDGNLVGINGIIVYRAGDQFYAFERMCPYEKETSCSVMIPSDDDPTIANCECCNSQFLVVDPDGSVIEGPATWGLKRYNARLQGHMLVITSN
jgi:nitrite reductase/ring-hydroxylating ferredoxin subunit